MHALDELLALSRGRDPAARRYFLSCMADLRPSFDTDVLLDFLWGEAAATEPVVARAARREVGRVLPEALKHGHALTRSARSVWSDYYGREQLERYLTDQALAVTTDAELAPLVANAMEALGGALAAAIPALSAADPRQRTIASLVLGQWKSPAAVDALKSRLAAAPGEIDAAAALAEHGGDDALHALIAHVGAHWRAQPDLLALLAGVPSPKVVPVLERVVPATTADGRACLAMALGGNSAPGARALLHRLAAWSEGWVVAGACKALTAHPQAADLPVVQEVYRRESHEFLRVQAVRTAGWLPGAQALAFLESGLSSGQPRVQAAALEGLARQRLAPDALARAARALLDSPLLKTRVNAVLALAKAAPDDCAGGITKLLFADTAGERLEGAWILGYIAGPEPAAALAAMAASDPDPAVRLQALKSMARQPASVALDRLVDVFVSGDPAISGLAAQALGDLDGLDAGVIEERLDAAIAARETVTVAGAPRPGRGLALRSLGRAAARTMASAPPKALVRYLADPDPALVRASLSGLRLLGDRAALPEVARLARHDDPRVRAGAAAAWFLAGDLGASRTLVDLLTSSEEASVKAGLHTLLELVTLVPATLRSARFMGLRRALGAGDVGEPPAAASGRIERPLQMWEPVNAPEGLLGTSKILAERYTAKTPALAPKKRAMDRATVEQLSYLGDLPRSGFLQTYGGLIAAPLIVLATIAFAAARPSRTEPAPGAARVAPAGTFTVRKVLGAPQAQPGGVLKARDFVAPGSTVSTRAGEEVEMTDADGSQVWLGPDSSIEVAAPPALLRAPAGDVLITFRDRPSVDVSTSGGVLKLERAMVRVQSQDRNLTAMVLAGQASWIARGENPVSGGPGAVLQLKR